MRHDGGKKAKQLNRLDRMDNALEKTWLERHWQGQEKSCVGIAWVCSAKEKTSDGPRWHGIALNSCGKAVLGTVKAMNGQEWLWKRYERRSLATEMPLKRL